ncbi:MAG TPA: cytochrome C oxidase subunit IV family protein [Anaeromyxobacteraceae bacterium]|nr:cytochrome C oxidase subunit IV family protein [Anaeromyxobacteraceae bacterium]
MTDSAAHASVQAASGHAAPGPHALPVRVLLGTALALFALTAVTVAISRADLGAWNAVAALGIAAAKASLVALFFMHLKYQGRFKAVVFVASVVFAVLLVAFVVFDTTQYQADVRAAARAGAARR